MSLTVTPERPLRVAVIGSGPSGIFAAEALLKSDLNVDIDVYDRLPTPYGLVRYGVAPDHLTIKSVTRASRRPSATRACASWATCPSART